MTEPDDNGTADALANSLLNGETALAWAESHARLGDFEYALKWLDMGEQVSNGGTRRFKAKRKRWTQAVEEQRQRA